MAADQSREQSKLSEHREPEMGQFGQHYPGRGEHERDRGYRHRAEQMDYEDVSPEQIEADIRRTRAEMDRTLDELQHRLSPRSVWNEIVGVFKKRRDKKKAEAAMRGAASHDADGGAGGTAKKIGKGALQTVRDHPVPTILMLTALTTLIYESANRRRGKAMSGSKIGPINIYRGEPTMYGGSQYGGSQSGELYREGEGGYGEEMGHEHRGQQQFEFGAEEESMREKATRGAKEMSSRIGEKVSHAGEAIRGGMHQAGHAFRSGTHRMREGASHMGEHMRHGMDEVRHVIEERPLTVGIGALAAGVLAGLLIPRTEKENRLMGQQSEKFMQRSREMGEDLMERGKHVAEEAIEAATEAANEASEREGLKPEGS